MAGARGDRPAKGGRWSAWKSVLVVEWIALLIGLAMPITPSKTGSDFSLADWFYEDPSYLQEVWVYFLFTNAMLGLLALVVLGLVKREQGRRGGDG